MSTKALETKKEHPAQSTNAILVGVKPGQETMQISNAQVPDIRGAVRPDSTEPAPNKEGRGGRGSKAQGQGRKEDKSRRSATKELGSCSVLSPIIRSSRLRFRPSGPLSNTSDTRLSFTLTTQCGGRRTQNCKAQSSQSRPMRNISRNKTQTLIDNPQQNSPVLL